MFIAPWKFVCGWLGLGLSVGYRLAACRLFSRTLTSKLQCDPDRIVDFPGFGLGKGIIFIFLVVVGVIRHLFLASLIPF